MNGRVGVRGDVVMQADDGLSLEQQVCFPFYEANNLLQQLHRPLLEPLGLTYSQFLVMLVLWDCAEGQEVSVGDIGVHLGLHTGTLSPLLKRMERDGHIIRERSIHDERRVVVHLTKAGRHLKEPARAIPAQLSKASGLSEEELHTIRQATKTFVKHLRAIPHR